MYRYEFNLMCMDLYPQGKWPHTPAEVKEKTFYDMIRIWTRQEEKCGADR